MLLSPAGLMGDKFPLDELTGRLAESPQVVVYPRRLVCRHDRCSLTMAATNPGTGTKLCIRQPQVSPSCSSTRRILAGSSGASDTSNESSGWERPSPSALTKASLRVQQLMNPSGLSRAG